jgi:hypothetical protein
MPLAEVRGIVVNMAQCISIEIYPEQKNML